MEYDDMTKKELAAELARRDEEDRYNGWSNRETWAFNLWMSNDQGSCEMVREMAEESYQEALADECEYLTTEQLAISNMAGKLKDYLDLLRDEIACESREIRMMLDDIGSSWRIDFREMAENEIGNLIRENGYQQDDERELA